MRFQDLEVGKQFRVRYGTRRATLRKVSAIAATSDEWKGPRMVVLSLPVLALDDNGNEVYDEEFFTGPTY